MTETDAQSPIAALQIGHSRKKDMARTEKALAKTGLTVLSSVKDTRSNDGEWTLTVKIEPVPEADATDALLSIGAYADLMMAYDVFGSDERSLNAYMPQDFCEAAGCKAPAGFTISGNGKKAAVCEDEAHQQEIKDRLDNALSAEVAALTDAAGASAANWEAHGNAAFVHRSPAASVVVSYAKGKYEVEGYTPRKDDSLHGTFASAESAVLYADALAARYAR